MGEVKVFQRDSTDVVVIRHFDLIGVSFRAGLAGFGIGDSRCPGTGLCPVADFRFLREGKGILLIEKLPQGLDTVLHEDSISQGQKQLLCITRVMLCLPPMLILDEATSSIDTRTELQIQEAFERMMEGRTSFIVAHRLSTIRNADLILVMKDGSIIEQGTHDELIAKGGFYHTLYNSQFAKVSE